MVEVELGAVNTNGCEAVYERFILSELKHPQVCILIKTNNNTTDGVINNTIWPNRIKAMDMWIHWLWDHKAQEQLELKLKRGKHNYPD